MGENNSAALSFLDPDVFAFEIENELDLVACEFAVPTSQLNCEALWYLILILAKWYSHTLDPLQP